MSKKPTKPTPLASLEKQLRERFSDACISIDAPSHQNATWFLDVNQDGHIVHIQWQQDRGFGISCSPEHTYGEGADEVYRDVEAVYARTVSLLLSKSYTSPPETVRLGELRRERHVSQVQLASLLDIHQAAVSKLEQRSDMHISTVRDAVNAMGGTLSLVVKFPDGMMRTLGFADDRANATEKNTAAT